MNSDSRRGFLAAVLAALAGGAAVAVSAKALADPLIGRYARVIKLQSDLYRVNQKRSDLIVAGADRYRDDRIKNLNAEIQVRADQLFFYMMDKFAVDEETMNSQEAEYLCDDLFRRRFDYDTMTVAGLKAILDVIVPVCIAKHCLSTERVALNTQIMKAFDPFAQKYKNMILGRGRPYNEACLKYPEWAARNGFTVDTHESQYRYR